MSGIWFLYIQIGLHIAACLLYTSLQRETTSPSISSFVMVTSFIVGEDSMMRKFSVKVNGRAFLTPREWLQLVWVYSNEATAADKQLLSKFHSVHSFHYFIEYYFQFV